jgi:hypothetical protein
MLTALCRSYSRVVRQSGDWRSQCWTPVLVSGCLGRVAKRRRDRPRFLCRGSRFRGRRMVTFRLEEARFDNWCRVRRRLQRQSRLLHVLKIFVRHLITAALRGFVAQIKSEAFFVALFESGGLQIAGGAAATRLGPCRRFCGLRPWCAGGIAPGAQRTVRRTHAHLRREEV